MVALCIFGLCLSHYPRKSFSADSMTFSDMTVENVPKIMCIQKLGQEHNNYDQECMCAKGANSHMPSESKFEIWLLFKYGNQTLIMMFFTSLGALECMRLLCRCVFEPGHGEAFIRVGQCTASWQASCYPAECDS